MSKTKPVFMLGKSLTWDEFVGEVRTMLRELCTGKGRDGLLRHIERTSGLGYRWLNDFKRGEYRDVTADYVIRVAQALGMRFRVLVDAIPIAGPPAGAGKPTPRKPTTKKKDS